MLMFVQPEQTSAHGEENCLCDGYYELHPLHTYLYELRISLNYIKGKLVQFK